MKIHAIFLKDKKVSLLNYYPITITKAITTIIKKLNLVYLQLDAYYFSDKIKCFILLGKILGYFEN